jgi:hypothetical protein
MLKFVIATIAVCMIALPATARDNVNHIACGKGSNGIMDVVRIVSTQVVNEQQVNNIDSLWHNNGSCILGPVTRKYTLDPRTASANGVWGWHEAGNVIILRIPSLNPRSDARVWWVRLDRIAYFANQIVNGRRSGDDLAWKVSEIRNDKNWGLPRYCHWYLRQIRGAHAIEVLNDGRNWDCDYLHRH